MRKFLVFFLIIGIKFCVTDCLGGKESPRKRLPESVKQAFFIKEKGFTKWWEKSNWKEKSVLISDSASVMTGFAGNLLCKNNSQTRTNTNILLGILLASGHVLLGNYINEQGNKKQKKLGSLFGIPTKYALEENLPKALALFFVSGLLGWGIRKTITFFFRLPRSLLANPQKN